MNKEELKKHRNRVAQRKFRYGITEEQYDNLLTEQDNSCAVCKIEFSQAVWPNIDHDHNCCEGAKSCGNCLRGLLCSNCLTIASLVETRFKYMDDLFVYLTKYLLTEVN